MIHIDFGFMLSISPGNIGFELAPFKLNQEMVDLIGGPNSDIFILFICLLLFFFHIIASYFFYVMADMFKYFKTLLLSGLLEVRRHADELVMLVEVMGHHSKYDIIPIIITS